GHGFFIKHMNKVSVIIPLYNQARFVKEAVDSVLSQTYGNIEVIVVDDGSTDNSKESLSIYIKQGKIRYVYQHNQDLAAARNTGLRMAQGQYVKFLDSDDFLYPEQIERQIEDIKNGPQVFSVTDYYDLRPHGEMVRRYAYTETDEKQLPFMIQSNRTVVH